MHLRVCALTLGLVSVLPGSLVPHASPVPLDSLALNANLVRRTARLVMMALPVQEDVYSP